MFNIRGYRGAPQGQSPRQVSGHAAIAAIAFGVMGLLAGCGGGDGRPAPSGDAPSSSGAGSASSDGGAPSLPPATPENPILGALSMQSLELGQTHLLPEGKLSWAPPSPANASESLHLVGGRESLALVRLSAGDAADPVIEGVLGGRSLGTEALNPPGMLPATEAQGPAYAGDLYSATLPASWLQPGLSLQVKAANYSAGAARGVEVGADMPFMIRTLPIYLFGANETNTQRPLSTVAALPSEALDEALAKWPVASLEAANHPAGMVQWSEFVVMPYADAGGAPQPAFVARSASDYKDGGFALLHSVIKIVQALRDANGDGPMSMHYYAPILALDGVGRYRSAGGGVGGSSVGVGDDAYAGIFIHEQGHAFGLPHVGEAYDKGTYPYPWGSLSGSAWGYDFNRHELLAPFVPSTAASFAKCATGTVYAGHPRVLDAAGRCVKQDPMQGGAGDEAAGYRFATFSDYSTAVIQRYFEGATTVDSKGVHVPASRLVADAAFASGYREWDTLDKRWVNAKVTTVQNGIRGLDRGLPQQKDVPVYAIALAISNAGTPGATYIYPPVAFKGNLVRMIDPTLAADRASIVPDTSANPWYCRNGGCDYTLRLTYADGSVAHRLLQGGFRPFNQARGTPTAAAADPLKPDSFLQFAVHVPADKPLVRIELLSTPMAWEGLPASPQVLAQRTL